MAVQSSGRYQTGLNPVSSEMGAQIGFVAAATHTDLEAAAEAVVQGFETWRSVSTYERSKVLRKVAQNLRARTPDMALRLRREQGKPLTEAQMEIANSTDMIEWFAEEGRRAYGRRQR